MIQFFHDGDTYFESVFQDIEKAQNRISIESYIFSYDDLGKKLLSHLVIAKKRGVHVEILVDGFGSYFWISPLRKFCLENNLAFRIYKKIPMSLFNKTRLFLNYIFQLSRLMNRINQRNHRKLILIDNKIAYLGSINISQVHSKIHYGPHAWRDTSLKFEGNINDLLNVFNYTWRRTRLNRRLPFRRAFDYHPQFSKFRLNTTRRWRRWLRKDLVRRIEQAQNEIYITSAYFLPTGKIVNALIAAKKRGTTVRVITPHMSDVFIVKLAGQQLIHRLVKAGIDVYEYLPTILHAKYTIIDYCALVGSFNFNHRSLLHDLEVEIRLDQITEVNQLKEQWELDKSNCRLLDDSSYKKLSYLQKILSYIVYKFRYWL